MGWVIHWCNLIQMHILLTIFLQDFFIGLIKIIKGSGPGGLQDAIGHYIMGSTKFCKCLFQIFEEKLVKSLVYFDAYNKNILILLFVIKIKFLILIYIDIFHLDLFLN